jgi:hypothetical protein
LTLVDVAQFLDHLSLEESIPQEVDELVPFLIQQAQDLNLLSRDVTANYAEVMKRA